MSTGLGADFEKPATVPGALHADPANGSTPITMGRLGRRRHDPRHSGRALTVGTADRRVGQSALKDALTELARFYRLELD